ncbi:MAG: chalcone isomerase family protein [Burkholderiales bacterium]|nr:chalcone isomerase family protein [Burkholderiales bacterium]
MLAALLVLALPLASAFAFDARGVRLPQRVAIAPGGHQLVLNGAGVHERARIELYVAGLYLSAPQANTKAVLADRGPKRLSLTLLRDNVSVRLTSAVLEALRDNLTEAEAEYLGGSIDELAWALNRLSVAKKGALVTLDFIPGSGTRIALDGVAHDRAIAGEALYSALLKVWLGDDPVDRKLRLALLGR